MQMHWNANYDYSGRKRKKKAPKGEVYKKFTAPPFTPLSRSVEPYRRGADATYKSADCTTGSVCAAPERKEYTGSKKLLGVATMHKSNLCPVWSEQEAKDIANMRRN